MLQIYSLQAYSPAIMRNDFMEMFLMTDLRKKKSLL